jgi:hypothetical protein
MAAARKMPNLNVEQVPKIKGLNNPGIISGV